MGVLALLLAFCFPTETETLSLGPTTDARRIPSHELNNTDVDFFILGSDAYSDKHSQASLVYFDTLSSETSSAYLFMPRSLGTPAYLLMLVVSFLPALFGDLHILRQAGSGPSVRIRLAQTVGRGLRTLKRCFAGCSTT